MNNSDLLEVAIIGKSVGLKGFVRLFDRSDFPNQFKKNAKFYDDKGSELVIESYIKDSSLVRFIGYDTVEKAKTLTNKVLYRTYQDTKSTCKLQKDEYFYFDIIDCKIVENSEILGTVKDILEMPLNHMFEVFTDEALIQNGYAKLFYAPYTDKFIEKVDVENKIIHTKNVKDILANS